MPFYPTTDNLAGTPTDRFQYNGKEKVDGLGFYEYGFRWSDPQIGRFIQVDKVTELAPDLTPFRYGFNNPVKFIDFMGLWEKTKNGYSTKDKKDIERFFLIRLLNQNLRFQIQKTS